MALQPQERQIVEFGRKQGKNRNEILQAIARFRSENQEAPAESTQGSKVGGFLSETLGDIRETGSAIREDVGRRAETTREAAQAQASGEQGAGRTLFQRFGQGLGAASDVVGQTVIGAGKALLPQQAEEFVGRQVGRGVEQVAEQEPVQRLLQNYQNLQQENPALARDIDSALGITTLGLDLATMGAGGRVVGAATRGVSRGAAGAGRAAGAVGRGGRRIGFELEGALTGTSQETLEEAFQAARRGGKQMDELTENLRGKVTPEELVENVRQATNIIESEKSFAFRNAFEPIANQPVRTAGVQDEVLGKLKNFGVKVGEEGLDFSNSRFRQTPQAQNKLQQMYEEVRNLENAGTLQEVDTTRQVLRELMLTGDDASARSANSLITQAIDSVRDTGKQVEGYDQILRRFGEDAEFLDELKRSLASGDKKTIDSTYRRLATSLKTNNERRMNLIRELDEATGGALLSSIAGQQLSEPLPRGLFRQIAAGMAGTGVVTGGLSSSLIPALVFASPRVTGEIVGLLGLGARKADRVTEAINSARKTLEDISGPTPLISPAVEGAERSSSETQ